MKKDFIFVPALLVIWILLGMLKITGMSGHIAVSVLGIVVLIAYTAATKKEWKIPALEIIMRVFYGIALISGVVIMKTSDMAAAAIVHKISAVVFLAVLVILFVHKNFVKKV